jgi:hypothetical protein
VPLSRAGRVDRLSSGPRQRRGLIRSTFRHHDPQIPFNRGFRKYISTGDAPLRRAKHAVTLPTYKPENKMSKNAMAGAVTLCGVGLCMIGGALLMQSGGQAHAAPSSLPATATVSSVASAQAGGEPTVVWYGMSAMGYSYSTPSMISNATERIVAIARAWSDGRVEVRTATISNCGEIGCSSAWASISSATQGYKATADINADELVDGVDLASVLSNWGEAPRVPFTPSDCPLNLINP